MEKAANSLDGVDSAAVNLMLGTLVCSYDADKVTPQAIISAVEASGYGAAPADEAKRDIRREQEASARAHGPAGFCGPWCVWCPCSISVWVT